LIDAFKGAIGQFADIGRSIMDGIGQGISSTIQSLKDKVTSAVNSIVNGAKSALGIKSPSTVFAGIGRDMGEGLGVGFEDAMAQVSRDMLAAIPTSFDIHPELQGSFSGFNSRSATGEGFPVGTTVNQSISIQSPKALSEKELAREFRTLSRRLALEI
jgi:hypothetical protein